MGSGKRATANTTARPGQCHLNNCHTTSFVEFQLDMSTVYY